MNYRIEFRFPQLGGLGEEEENETQNTIPKIRFPELSPYISSNNSHLTQQSAELVISSIIIIISSSRRLAPQLQPRCSVQDGISTRMAAAE
jgi:hypothetical protein